MAAQASDNSHSAAGNVSSTGTVITSKDSIYATVTDQAGKARKSEIDALGRLIKVIEDARSGGLNYETSYLDDVLGNLTRVTQGTQTPRTFNYSSLSRLTSAFNPESGTIEYKYDAAGNLVLKIDPRTRPGSGSLSNCSIPYAGTKIAICYEYDSLNRLKTRAYNDGTPAVTYSYGASGVAYSKGRLTSVASTVSTTNYSEYDALGRVKQSNQVTNGQTYPMSYAYDMAGNLKSQTYSSGKVIETEYDAAGRMAGLKKQGGGYYAGAASTDAQNRIRYSAHGAITAIKLGNSLWEHTNFNSRLQPVEIGLGASATDSGTLKLSYAYGVRVNNVLDATDAPFMSERFGPPAPLIAAR